MKKESLLFVCIATNIEWDLGLYTDVPTKLTWKYVIWMAEISGVCMQIAEKNAVVCSVKIRFWLSIPMSHFFKFYFSLFAVFFFAI